MTTPKPKSIADYERALKLLGVFTRCTHLLAALESRANSKLTKLAEAHAHKFATLQARITEAETTIIALAEAHPEWFPEHDRTVKSLLGSIHAQKTTRHEIGDEGEAIAAFEEAAVVYRSNGDAELAAKLEACVVTTKTLDLAAVGKLTEDELALSGVDEQVERVVEDSITVKPAKVKLGNAVKKAAAAKAKGGAK